MGVVGEDDVGAHEDVVLDGHQLEEAAAWMRTRSPMRLPNSSDGVGADADVVAELVVLADAGALAGLQAGAEGAPGVDGRERPDDGAGADGERALALAGAPRRLADDARRLQVAALAQRDVGIQDDAGRRVGGDVTVAPSRARVGAGEPRLDAAGLERRLRRLEGGDHAQPGPAVGDRRLAAAHAVDEVLRLEPQRLGAREILGATMSPVR